MKVYYVSNRYDGCWYVRCYLPMVANGWDGDKTSPYGERADANKKARACMASDVIVFQRPDQPEHVELAKLLKMGGKKIVFDNDDTYKENSGVPTTMQDLNGSYTLAKMNKSLEGFMKEADLVTTTTECLADEYRKINDSVVVLPNTIDPDDWEEPKRNSGDKVRIGMVGSVVSNEDYVNAIPIMEHYKDDPNVQFVILGLPPRDGKHNIARKAYHKEIDFWDKWEIEWQHFVPQAKYNEFLNDLELDIMLIPRHDSYFNRCKSNIKFLEASMCEIPIVAQGFEDGKSPYQGKEDAKHMVVVTDNDKWIEEVDRLVQDKDLRRSMGKKAREYVLLNYNINERGIEWYNKYKALLN